MCHCRQVTRATIERTLEAGRARSLADLQRETTACTRCFGCRFELQAMLRERLGDAYEPTSHVTPLERVSPLQRAVRRLRPRAGTLPRRMYMPILSGFAGRFVSTRVIMFNWPGDAREPSLPTTLRADVLALDGRRHHVRSQTVPPGCTRVLDLPSPPGGVGTLKLVIDAESLGSLRPYFHLVTPAGITSTHEKAGPLSPRTFEGRRPYHWVFPTGRSDFPEEAWLFVTNTQQRPTADHAVIWQDVSGIERRIPFPELELDQTAWVPLHEHVPELLEGSAAGVARIEPASHKFAGFIIRYQPVGDLWRVQHL